jgi:hypothetical protein
MTTQEAIDTTLVQETVLKAHFDLDRVEELLRQEPRLANASWDWGGGDWETPLGSAAHTGQTAIAEALLSAGARLDIFAAAMLGKLDIVKSIVAAYPEMMSALGPHGISLLAHAQAGGDQSTQVAAFLQQSAAGDL